MNQNQKKSEIPFVLWIGVLGGVGFAAGFFGPMLLAPEANQGPMVGIFISGPGGALLGFIFYGVSRALKWSRQTQRHFLQAACGALAFFTLYSVIPSPARRGDVIEIKVQSCQAVAEKTEEIISYWKNRIAKVTWASPRAGWQEQMTQALKNDPGLILEGIVIRKNEIKVHQEPWSMGRMFAAGWKTVNEAKSFYIAGSPHQCADFPPGFRGEYFLEQGSMKPAPPPEKWPPQEVSNFINYSVLTRVPAEVRGKTGLEESRNLDQN